MLKIVKYSQYLDGGLLGNTGYCEQPPIIWNKGLLSHKKQIIWNIAATKKYSTMNQDLFCFKTQMAYNIFNEGAYFCQFLIEIGYLFTL